MAAVQQNWDVLLRLCHCGETEFVMAAVQHWYVLRYASATLKNDKEVVMAAVQQNGYALKHAYATLQNDKEVICGAAAELMYCDRLCHSEE